MLRKQPALESELSQRCHSGSYLKTRTRSPCRERKIRERVKGDQPPTEDEELQARMAGPYKLAQKLKVWSNPKKRQKLESLLAQMEALLAESD